MAAYSLAELARLVGGNVVGDDSVRIEGVATLANASPRQISFLANPHYQQQLSETRAAAVILAEPELAQCPVNALVTSNPYVSYARVAALFAPTPAQQHGIHPAAYVSPDAVIHETAWIGPNCSVEAGVTVDANTRIGPGCFIGGNSSIGADSLLVGNVSICHGVHIGCRNIIHAGAVIGSDGFGFANVRGEWLKVPQLGGVVIGDDVEIGANTTIDRGALDDTVIEHGVKLDNQIQVAHNVFIGAHTAIAGCAGISGSTRVGRRCAIAGGVGIAGHLEIADDVTITAMSLVLKSIREPGSVYSSGIPVEPNRLWNRRLVHFRRLDEMAARLKSVEHQLSTDINKQED